MVSAIANTTLKILHARYAMSDNKKVIVSQTRSLFWPIAWLFLFWPVGILWMIFRLEHNFKIEQSYAPIVLLIAAVIFYVVYASVHHDWTLSPLTCLFGNEGSHAGYYYDSITQGTDVLWLNG